MNIYQPPFYIPIDNNKLFFQEEINKLKDKINILEEKIKEIENSKKNNYLKKDDNYYMI